MTVTRAMRAIAAVLMALAVATAGATTHRSTSARNAFKRSHPCPATGRASTAACPGYVIDHIKPLACGGADAPSNMQWQTTAAAKEKDKWERKECGR